MTILPVICVTAVCAAIVITVKDTRPEFSILVSISVGAALLIFSLSVLSPYISQIRDMAKNTSNSQIFQTAVKAVGICLLSEFAANTCTDYGQSSLASKARLMGRIGLLILALPYAAKVLQVAEELVQ